MSTEAKRRITLERTYPASIQDVWAAWTTREGIESWWGPDGFTVEVLELELRPGGPLRYAMTARAPEMVAYMKSNGMPLTNENRATFSEIAAPARLAYDSWVDFVPGLAPYAHANLVELFETAAGVRVVLSFDAMHDEEWTTRLVTGRESQLDKLATKLAAGAR
jgi:uncharacterized protein YndB with AHSA1/START domain